MLLYTGPLASRTPTGHSRVPRSVRTLHVLCGAGVLAASVVAAVQAYRAAAQAANRP